MKQYVRWRLAQLAELVATFRYAWRRTWQLGLGDEIVAGGRRARLAQGVCAPLWECVTDSPPMRFNAHECEMRKVRTIANYVGSFRSGWRFHFGYWFDIGVGRRLGLPYAYYGTDGYLARRQRRRDRAYIRAVERGA